MHSSASSSAEAVLQYYLRDAPNAPFVSLRNCGITSLTPLLPALSQLQSMLSLDLSGNYLESLPSGTDMAACMPHLQALDVSRNPMDPFRVVESLQPLRTLQDLRLAVPDSETVRHMVWSLPSVQVLNGVRVVSGGGTKRPPPTASDNATRSPLASERADALERVREMLQDDLHPHSDYRHLFECVQAMNKQSGEKATQELEVSLFGVEEKVDGESDIIRLAHRRIAQEQHLFKQLLDATAKATTAAIGTAIETKSTKSRAKTKTKFNEKEGRKVIIDDTAQISAPLQRVVGALESLSQCYGKLELRVSSLLEATCADRDARLRMMSHTSLQKGAAGIVSPRPASAVSIRPVESLVSLLSLAHKLTKHKERWEAEQRGASEEYASQTRCGCCCYYFSTVRQHMCAFFVDEHPHEAEANIAARVVQFLRDLHHFADVEKCIEAYVFAQIIDNVIEESYWTFFESLCEAISAAIAHVASTNSPTMPQTNAAETEKTAYPAWLHHRRTQLGFISKAQAFRVIDTMIPAWQRDSPLHIELVENAVTLLSADRRGDPSVTVSAFCRAILVVFVRQHERSIRPIVRAFQATGGRGTRNSGLVSVAQLREGLRRLGPVVNTPEFFLNVLRSVRGPLGAAPITFSAVVDTSRQLLHSSSSSTVPIV